jgi:hypothetical protein
MKKDSVSAIFGQLPDDKRHEAEELHNRLIALFGTLEQSRKRMLSVIAKLFGAPEEIDRDRIIWHGIITLANRHGTDDKDIGVDLAYFKALVFLCAWRLEGEPPDFADDLSRFRDLDFTVIRSKKKLEEALAEALPILRDRIWKVLLWLTEPNKCAAAFKQDVLCFLQENSEEGAVEFCIDPVSDFDETGNRGYPLFYWKKITGYSTISSPIAKFIFDQIEKYHADELPLAEAIPVVKCKRTNCERFAVPRRRTREFCSDSCRTLFRQKTKAAVHAEYMRKYRAENY